MDIHRCKKSCFVVIGKEGSTKDGKDFIKTLWKDANFHFNEIKHLAKTNSNGDIIGIWGAMSDFSRSFNPWENNFSQGLYLAGVECKDCAQAPTGWTKWVIPQYEYMYVENENPTTFANMLGYLKEHNIPLVGAIQEFTFPKDGKTYLYFPVKKL